MMNPINRRIALTFATAALALGLGACVEDESLVRPQLGTTQTLFRRYVAMGNSLTAGWMSAGINRNTQELAYPVLLADMANVSFEIPRLALPGCPPPLVGVVDTDSLGNVILEEDRLGGPAAQPCSLREGPAPQFINNVAVPGAKIADAFDIDREGNASNTLTTLINGGLSQVESMRRAQPTFVTSWLGNNDALDAALEGDTTLLTPADSFAFYHSRVASGIGQSGARGAVLIGVLDVTLAPLLQPGLYYWLADSLGFAPRVEGHEPKEVSADCGPTDAEGDPNPLSMNEISWRIFADTMVDVISCDPSAPYVLTPAELDAIQDMVAEYNDTIEAEATSRGWSYLDATVVLDNQLTGAAQHNRLRLCTGLSNTVIPTVMVDLFTTRCPHPNAPNYFGSFVTFDGIHMSAEAHQIFATALGVKIEQDYDVPL